jgi:DNA-binding response OmpR family regulator
MSRVQLIHWHLEEARERAGWLEAAGYEVAYQLLDGPRFLRRLREEPPAAVVIDLGRLPSQGRDVALSIRRQGATHHVPLVFVGGEAAKVARLKELLPDICAIDDTWSGLLFTRRDSPV